MIASLEDSRIRSEKDADETHEILLETERLKQELEEELASFDQMKEKLEKKAKEKARKLLKMQNVKQKQSFLIYVQCI